MSGQIGISTEKRSSPRLKPIHIMAQAGISEVEKAAIKDGIDEMMRLAGVSLPVKDFGSWRMKDWKDSNGILKPMHSIDWYIERGRIGSDRHGQLNGWYIIGCLHDEKWRRPSEGGKDHYDVMITFTDLYYHNKFEARSPLSYVIGLGLKDFGTVMSVQRFLELPQELKYGCLKTEAMHEMGHVFGLIPDERTDHVEDRIGKHCTNRCIMRQGLSVPRDWINLTQDRLKYGALCKTCEKDLKDFFR